MGGGGGGGWIFSGIAHCNMLFCELGFPKNLMLCIFNVSSPVRSFNKCTRRRIRCNEIYFCLLKDINTFILIQYESIPCEVRKAEFIRIFEILETLKCPGILFCPGKNRGIIHNKDLSGKYFHILNFLAVFALFTE